ncbi:hypothetical protein LACDD01_01452 [Lactococcus sp. DD01]|nr:hypothetical protein LACDD01_01452 [Lactococcus sp. DD01]
MLDHVYLQEPLYTYSKYKDNFQNIVQSRLFDFVNHQELCNLISSLLQKKLSHHY